MSQICVSQEAGSSKPPVREDAPFINEAQYMRQFEKCLNENIEDIRVFEMEPFDDDFEIDWSPLICRNCKNNFNSNHQLIDHMLFCEFSVKEAEDYFWHNIISKGIQDAVDDANDEREKLSCIYKSIADDENIKLILPFTSLLTTYMKRGMTIYSKTRPKNNELVVSAEITWYDQTYLLFFSAREIARKYDDDEALRKRTEEMSKKMKVTAFPPIPDVILDAWMRSDEETRELIKALKLESNTNVTQEDIIKEVEKRFGVELSDSTDLPPPPNNKDQETSLNTLQELGNSRPELTPNPLNPSSSTRNSIVLKSESNTDVTQEEGIKTVEKRFGVKLSDSTDLPPPPNNKDQETPSNTLKKLGNSGPEFTTNHLNPSSSKRNPIALKSEGNTDVTQGEGIKEVDQGFGVKLSDAIDLPPPPKNKDQETLLNTLKQLGNSGSDITPNPLNPSSSKRHPIALKSEDNTDVAREEGIKEVEKRCGVKLSDTADLPPPTNNKDQETPSNTLKELGNSRPELTPNPLNPSSSKKHPIALKSEGHTDVTQDKSIKEVEKRFGVKLSDSTDLPPPPNNEDQVTPSNTFKKLGNSGSKFTPNHLHPSSSKRNPIALKSEANTDVTQEKVEKQFGVKLSASTDLPPLPNNKNQETPSNTFKKLGNSGSKFTPNPLNPSSSKRNPIALKSEDNTDVTQEVGIKEVEQGFEVKLSDATDLLPPPNNKDQKTPKKVSKELRNLRSDFTPNYLNPTSSKRKSIAVKLEDNTEVTKRVKIEIKVEKQSGGKPSASANLPPPPDNEDQKPSKKALKELRSLRSDFTLNFLNPSSSKRKSIVPKRETDI